MTTSRSLIPEDVPPFAQRADITLATCRVLIAADKTASRLLTWREAISVTLAQIAQNEEETNMNPANIPGTHHRFTWNEQANGHHTCDMPGGTLRLWRVRQAGSSYDVRWNARHIGLAFNLEEARALAERLYMEGRL